MIPDPTHAPSGSQEPCAASTPGVTTGYRGAHLPVELRCHLPAGHCSPEHVDLRHGPWLHPDDPLPPEPTPLLPPKENR